MKFIRFFSLFMYLTVAISATAQLREVYGGAVEIMEIDDNRATFTSVGIDSDDKKVLVAAEKNLFQKILYDGVEGFNDDKPLVERDSPVLDAFFHGKYQKELMGIRTGTKNVENSLAYRAYVVNSQLEDEPRKNEEGKYTATAVIVVNCLTLRNYLKTNKVILDGDSVVVIKENVKQERPNFLQRFKKNN